jgi:hypothetical protein
MWLGISLVYVFFAVQTTFPNKAGETMRQRYGPPISDTFLVRLGLVVSASYGKNGQFCELFIGPQKATTPIKSADQTRSPPSMFSSLMMTFFIFGLSPT